MFRTGCLLFTMLFISTASGLEWKEFPIERHFLHFSFATPEIGWAIEQNGGIFETTDGGKTWNKMTFQCNLEYETVRTPVFFYSNHHRWIVNNDTIHYSNNGGSTWVSFTPEIKGLKSVCFINDSDGVANTDTIMYWTNDCGRKWQKAEMDSTNKLEILSTKFLDSENGWISGWSVSHWDAGTILGTSDGGRTWKTVLLSYILNDIYCTDSLHCFAVGLDWVSRRGVLTMTTDGWKTKKDVNFEPYLDKVVFLNAQTGIILGDGLVWETNDSGNTWTKIENVGTVLSIGRSTNALFISSMGKMYKYELATSLLTNQYQMYNCRNRFVPSYQRMVYLNINQTAVSRLKVGFDLLGKSATRITGYSQGCYLVIEKHNLYW